MFGSYEFDWSAIPGSLSFLGQGLLVSLEITALAIVAGLVWGTLLAMARLSSIKPLAWLAAGYVNLFRAIPLVMVLLWFFLIVPKLLESVLGLPPGSDVRLASAMIGFALFESAYYAEIIRAVPIRAGRNEVRFEAAAAFELARFVAYTLPLEAYRSAFQVVYDDSYTVVLSPR